MVDVGCGPGSITRDIAAWMAPGWVIGVDTNADRLAIAHRLIRQSRLQNVCLHVGEATRLALREETADLVFAHGLIEHLSAPAVAVQAFSRVLKPGGWMALRSPDWGSLLLEPTRPPLLASIDLRHRWQRHNDMCTLLREPALHALSARYGWSREADIADMIRAWSSWSMHPHAFVASFWCHAMARKSMSPSDPTLEKTGPSRLGSPHRSA